MKVYFIRHCSVNYTDNPKIDLDLHLSKIGYIQSIELIDAPMWEEVKTVITSPLNRAVETVALTCKQYNIKLELNSGLRELDYCGSAAKFHKKIIDDALFKHPGGETLSEANIRFDSTVRSLLLKKRKSFAISTHGTVLSQYLIKNFKLDKDYFFKLSYPDIYLVEYKNSVPHTFCRLKNNLPNSALNGLS